MRERIVHPINPVYDSNSQILILGSFPSVKSREEGFFYGNRQNRFWRVLSALLDQPVPESIKEKKALLLRHGIAVWDVIGECTIEGSDDASIEEAMPNGIKALIDNSSVKAVFTNGKTASKLYRKLVFPTTGIMDTSLPSTSPRNASWTLEKLIGRWECILESLG